MFSFFAGVTTFIQNDFVLEIVWIKKNLTSISYWRVQNMKQKRRAKVDKDGSIVFVKECTGSNFISFIYFIYFLITFISLKDLKI